MTGQSVGAHNPKSAWEKALPSTPRRPFRTRSDRRGDAVGPPDVWAARAFLNQSLLAEWVRITATPFPWPEYRPRRIPRGR